MKNSHQPEQIYRLKKLLLGNQIQPEVRMMAMERLEGLSFFRGKKPLPASL